MDKTNKQNTKQNTKENKEDSGTKELELMMALQNHQLLINTLADFIKGKMNVHGEIRKLTASLGSSFKKLAEAVETSEPRPQRPTISDSVTQTTPPSQRTYSQMTKEGTKTQDKTETVAPERRQIRKTKRKVLTSPEGMSKVVKRTKNEATPPPLAVGQPEKSSHQGTEWKKVGKKKPDKKKRNVRPNAVLIRPKEREKYADILKRVKQDATVENVGQYVDKIRKTKAGDMLLVLTKENNDKAAEIKKTVADILGNEATVVTKVPEVAIEIKDLDETTTKYEVLEALLKVVNGYNSITLDAITSIRPTYAGTQTATVQVDVPTATKIVGDRGKIKIGWVNCRVRRVEKPMKCYRCWRYGHLAGNCTSTTDRSQLCVKCGGKGHKIMDCKQKPSCVLCIEDGKEDDCAHIAGCGKCIVFRAALQAVRKKQKW